MCARPANPELRQKILDAAVDIVENCGPDCVTMREVAEKIGYSPTSIYLHFKDKHEMLREVVLYGFDDFAASMRSWAVGPTPLDKMRQRAHGYLAWGIDHPGMYQLMFESRIDLVTGQSQEPRARQSLVDGADVMREAIDSGQLSEPDDATMLGVAIWSGLHGVTSLAIARRVGASDNPSRQELVETGVRLVDTIQSALLEPYLLSPVL
jgi:AcrR family transcriptional regulator